MKLSISNIAWAKEDDSLIYNIMTENNFHGLEIAPTRFFPTDPYSDENILNAKNIFDKLPFQISSMQSILYGRSEAIFGSKQERLTLLDYLKKSIDYAGRLSINNLVFGSPKNRIISDYKTDYHLAVDFFANAANYAKDNGTVLSIEANPTIYNTNFINTTKEAYQLIRDVNCPAFMINLDFGTIVYNKEKLSDIEKFIDKINHVHISEPNLNLIENREEHKQLCKILEKNDYNKFVSIEMKNLSSNENIKKTIEYIAGVFNVD